MRIIQSLLRGFFGRCPVCGRGKMFKSYYGLREMCPVCGTHFERTGNQSTGGMAINMVLTIFLGFALGIMLVLSTPEHIWRDLALLSLGLIIFHLIFYRFAKGLWLGITALSGDMKHAG